MKIKDNHLVEGVRYDLIPGGASMPIRRFLVIHNTAGATGQSSIDWWKSQGGGVCAHFVVERDGTIIQCRPCNRTAGHVGVSKWKDPSTDILYTGLNNCSIGIELANAGFDAPGRDAFDWAKKQPGFTSRRARHKHGGPVVEWEEYPMEQVVACENLAKVLVAQYSLDDVAGHEDVSKGRKVDPGPLFVAHMRRIRKSCGIDRMLPL